MSELGPSDFDDLFSRNEKSLSLFYAVWYSFCQTFEPIFDSIETNFLPYSTKLNDGVSPLWDRFSLETVPTIIHLDGDKLIGRKDTRKEIGVTKDDVDTLIKELKA
jgi:thioredoxin 1